MTQNKLNPPRLVIQGGAVRAFLFIARIDFATEQWPAVKTWYDQLEGTPTGTFGQDQGGNTVIGKMLKTGQVLTSESSHLPNLMVLWQARSMLEQTLRKESTRNQQWELICNPSKP